MLTVTDHLLTVLIEECAEVQQRATKALRFGLRETQAGQPLDNQERLAAELDDLRATVELLEEALVVPVRDVESVRAKKRKVMTWLDYSRTINRVAKTPVAVGVPALKIPTPGGVDEE